MNERRPISETTLVVESGRTRDCLSLAPLHFLLFVPDAKIQPSCIYSESEDEETSEDEEMPGEQKDFTWKNF